MPFYYCRSVTRGGLIQGGGGQISLVTMPYDLDSTHHSHGHVMDLNLHMWKVSKGTNEISSKVINWYCAPPLNMKNPP